MNGMSATSSILTLRASPKNRRRTVVIPTYRPGARLMEFIEKLKSETDFHILVADDGSGPAFRERLELLERMGCTVLITPKHAGKGSALKAAFRYLLEHPEKDAGAVAVTGGYAPSPSEVLQIAEATMDSGRSIVLGVRASEAAAARRSRFSKAPRPGAPSVPELLLLNARSGIRGYPRTLYSSLLETDGNGADYELNILLGAGLQNYLFDPVPSGCKPLFRAGFYRFGAARSALLSGLFLIRFCMSGLLSAAVDYLLLFLLQQKTGNLLVSVVGARAVSSILNYGLNRFFVFESKNAKRQKTFEMLRYYGLVLVLLAANYLLLRTLSQTLKANLFLSKLVTEAVLFLFSFVIQRLFVFQANPTESGGPIE